MHEVTADQPRTSPGTVPVDVKPRSRDVTDGIQKAASRAMLRAIGLTDEDMAKPQVGIANSWNEITPCNMTLRTLAEHVKDGVREAGERLRVDTAVLHLGCVRFPVTGPVRYTLTARDAVELCEIVRPRVAIPVHYEGWSHFKQGRAAVERAFADAPEEVRSALRWVPIGTPVDLEVSLSVGAE